MGKSCVSVLVVDDEEEERGYHVGHGDVWSVSLWAPVRALTQKRIPATAGVLVRASGSPR
ncbi:hypothetical protein ACFXPW_19645 [Streptomyces goshikiensis]|uniref:hypothetical protein n=1 Tax=Streptomyces goshikiensis TaxID=1942 RepID=UPI00369DD937